MNYQKMGFRALYKHLAVFPLKEEDREAMNEYPGVEIGNCILVYGYIDYEGGMTLEVLAIGIEQDGELKFFDSSSNTRFFIRIGAIETEGFALLDDSDGSLKKRYVQKLEMLSTYEVDGGIERTREMTFLDDFRHPHYPDDVQVFLVREGFEPELCWVRIVGIGEHWFMGTLLNEPMQNFGCHRFNTITFFLQEMGENKIYCFSNGKPDLS